MRYIFWDGYFSYIYDCYDVFYLFFSAIACGILIVFAWHGKKGI